ncbi:hypothetical protein [Acinetobacter baumannii]|uniref:hypothetical protein n=1 Tax=Acinetobacter baumannii TaxID=470 RepID=UPI002FBE2B46
MTDSFLDHLIALLGQSNKDKILIDFFVSNNFINSANDLNLPIYGEDGELLDEYNLYISRYKEGLSFIFTDETFFLNYLDKPISGENLYLSTIFFYNEWVEGFSQYENSFPFNLDFSMKNNELEEILGIPIFTKDDDNRIIRSQKWAFKDKPYTLYASSTNTGKIRYISLTLPY